MQSLLHRAYGLQKFVSRRPTQDEFRGINWESRQNAGLLACFPLWGGGGAAEIDLVSGRFVGQPTNTLDAWDPQMGRVYFGDGGKPTGAGKSPSIARHIEILPYPWDLDFGQNTDSNVPPTPHSFSLSVWINTTWSLQAGVAGEGQYMVSFDNASGAFPGWAFSTLAPVLADNTWQTLEHNIDSAGAQTSMYSHNKINDGLWHLAVFTYDWDVPTGGTTEQRIYFDLLPYQTQVGGDVNGGTEVLIPLESGMGRSHVGTTHLYIGSDDDGISGGWAGMMCDMRIYNRVLQVGDVQHMYMPETRWELYRPRRRIAYFVPPAGGGNLVTRTATDAPTTAESLSRIGQFLRSGADAPLTAEALVRSLIALRVATDVPATAESIARLLGSFRLVTDAPATVETASRNLSAVRAAIDGPSSADTSTRAIVGSRSVIDAPATSDSIARNAVASRSATDVPQTAESIVRQLAGLRFSSESPATADISIRLFVGACTATDVPTTAETATNIVGVFAVGTDAPTTSEVPTRRLVGSRPITDVPTTSEIVARTFVGARVFTDIPTTAEIVTRLFVGARSTTDAPTSAESLLRIFVGPRSATETPTTAEILNRLFVGVRSTTETPTTVDSAVGVKSGGGTTRTAADAPTTAEVATRMFTGSRAGPDAPMTAEAATRLFVGHRADTDAPVTSEAASRAAAMSRFGVPAFVPTAWASWSFNGNFVDSTVNSNNLTPSNGPTFVSGQFGQQAAQFVSGSSQKASITANVPLPGNDITICGWFQFQARVASSAVFDTQGAHIGIAAWLSGSSGTMLIRVQDTTAGAIHDIQVATGGGTSAQSVNTNQLYFLLIQRNVSTLTWSAVLTTPSTGLVGSGTFASTNDLSAITGLEFAHGTTGGFGFASVQCQNWSIFTSYLSAGQVAAVMAASYPYGSGDQPGTAESMLRLLLTNRSVVASPATTDVAIRLFVGARSTVDVPTTSEFATALRGKTVFAVDVPLTSDSAGADLTFGVRTALDFPQTAEFASFVIFVTIPSLFQQPALVGAFTPVTAITGAMTPTAAIVGSF